MTKKAGTSSFGIDYVVFGIVDDAGKLLTAENGVSTTGIVLVDGDGQGATTANVTNIEAAGTEQYANNQVKRIAHGLSRPQVALTMLDLDLELSNKMLGYDTDKTGGAVLRNGAKPNVAMLIASRDFNNNYHYLGFANGEMIETAMNHGTNNANETDANATFTYQALAPIPDGIFTDANGSSQPMKIWNSGLTGFDSAAMLKEVFGGYTGADIVKSHVSSITKPSTGLGV
ncbi:phage tail protein [Lactobacillus delbrueckii]|uniref:phage tail protein n=1 Tax=Lactobacillus delbrueckii TaxID=1584 RepID=UPI001E3663C5|nr:phage tail protein [Lactobacillus delbrueckii]MCD5446170.1 phage tail protein [Lactobacillus delbrueckii subsp. lactis]MCZ0776437.1 phage tail protein [Lactobacillus delbrueckii subsp. sunkii]MCZ0793542.1 phage tail protein [Lactobacillus delbrueckii]